MQICKSVKSMRRIVGPGKITFRSHPRSYYAIAGIECQLKLSKVSESFIEGRGEKQIFPIALVGRFFVTLVTFACGTQ